MQGSLLTDQFRDDSFCQDMPAAGFADARRAGVVCQTHGQRPLRRPPIPQHDAANRAFRRCPTAGSTATGATAVCAAGCKHGRSTDRTPTAGAAVITAFRPVADNRAACRQSVAQCSRRRAAGSGTGFADVVGRPPGQCHAAEWRRAEFRQRRGRRIGVGHRRCTDDAQQAGIRFSAGNRRPRRPVDAQAGACAATAVLLIVAAASEPARVNETLWRCVAVVREIAAASRIQTLSPQDFADTPGRWHAGRRPLIFRQWYSSSPASRCAERFRLLH